MFRGKEVKFGPQQIGAVMSVELGQTKEAEASYALAAWKRDISEEMELMLGLPGVNIGAKLRENW